MKRLTRRERAAQECIPRLLRLADEARRRLDAFFSSFGLTGQQYNVLRILRGAREPLPTMEVADRMMEKTPGLTGLLDRLEGKGLVRRERCEDDRRVWLCSLTDEGLARVAAIDAPLRSANVDALGAPTTAQLEALRGALAELESGVEEGL